MEHTVETTQILKEIQSLRGEFQGINTKVAVLYSNVEMLSKDAGIRTQQMESIKDVVTELKHDVRDFRKDFDEHIEEELNLHIQKDAMHDTQLEKLQQNLVPYGDLAGHKTFHQNEMEKRKDTAEIKKDVVSHVLKGIIWASIVGVIYAIWEYLKEAIKS